MHSWVFLMTKAQVGKPGSEDGAQAFRMASYEYFPYWFEYQVDLEGHCVDCGNVRIPKVSPELAHERIYRAVREVLRSGLIPIICGGDHSISIPASRALSDHIGENASNGLSPPWRALGYGRFLGRGKNDKPLQHGPDH